MNLCVLSSEIWSPRESRYSLLSSEIVSVTDSSKVFFQREKAVLSIFLFYLWGFLLYLGIWKMDFILSFGRVVLSWWI